MKIFKKVLIILICFSTVNANIYGQNKSDSSFTSLKLSDYLPEYTINEWSHSTFNVRDFLSRNIINKNYQFGYSGLDYVWFGPASPGLVQSFSSIIPRAFKSDYADEKFEFLDPRLKFMPNRIYERDQSAFSFRMKKGLNTPEKRCKYQMDKFSNVFSKLNKKYRVLDIANSPEAYVWGETENILYKVFITDRIWSYFSWTCLTDTSGGDMSDSILFFSSTPAAINVPNSGRK